MCGTAPTSQGCLTAHRSAADLDSHPPVPMHSSVTATSISVSLLVSAGLYGLPHKPNHFGLGHWRFRSIDEFSDGSRLRAATFSRIVSEDFNSLKTSDFLRVHFITKFAGMPPLALVMSLATITTPRVPHISSSVSSNASAWIIISTSVISPSPHPSNLTPTSPR